MLVLVVVLSGFCPPEENLTYCDSLRSGEMETLLKGPAASGSVHHPSAMDEK